MFVATKAQMALDQRSWEFQGFVSGAKYVRRSISAASAFVQIANARTSLAGLPAHARNAANPEEFEGGLSRD
jgi:hypothetical protein